MPTQTEFAKLYMYDNSPQDASELFLTFRTNICGTGTDSNMQKIDSYLKKYNTSINSAAIYNATCSFATSQYTLILSDSVLATSMMAFIVFKVSGENRDASHEEMIILNALGSMTDYDMRNMYYLCKNCVTAKKGDLTAEKKFDNDRIRVERRSSCNITLNLLASYGVVQKRPSTIDAEDMDDIRVPANAAQSSPEEAEVVLNLDGEYALNSVTELFYHYMCGMSQLYRDELL